MLVPSLLALLLLPQQAPADSMGAIVRAQQLVAEYYRRPVERTGTCTGVSLQDCRQGDWSCRLGDCTAGFATGRREYLIRQLEDLAAKAGGSDWLTRQRVGFAVKNGELDRAWRIAESCAGTEWECLALRGFVEHQIDPDGGLAEFDSMYVRAPEDVRCDWWDLRPLTQAAAALGQDGGDCASPEPPGARFWWMADPLWSRAGNERYAEHLSRHVMRQMHEDVYMLLDSIQEGRYPTTSFLRAVVTSSYQRDIAEGFWNSWGRAVTTYRRLVKTRVRGRDEIVPCNGRAAPSAAGKCTALVYAPYVHGGYSFAPGVGRMTDPVHSRAEDWAVYWEDGGPGAVTDPYAERYIPRERYENLVHQTVVLRRGERLQVVTAAPLPGTFDTEGVASAYFVLGNPEDLSTISTPAAMDSFRVVRSRVEAPEAAYLASIEVATEKLVGRARYGALAPPLDGRGFGISDLALVEPRYERGDLALEEALLPSLDVPGGGRVAMYFEVYGMGEDTREPLEITLIGRRIGRSFFSKLKGALGLGSSGSVRMQWREAAGPAAEGRIQRVFALDLSNLAGGQSRLELSVRRADGRTASTERIVRVGR